MIIHPPWLTLHAAVVLTGLVLYVAASLGRRQRRHPSAAIAWVITLALIPYIALPLFLLFGMRKTVRAPRRNLPATPMASTPGTSAERLQALAIGLGMPPAVPYRELVIHEQGQVAFDRLRQLLRSAKRTLDVSTFILGNDALGAEICALLAQRARDGVKVRLMIDGVGRYIGHAPSLGPLKRAGVQVRFFASPWSSPPLGPRANLRNHRKLAAADGDWLWSGGRNLAAHYFIGVQHSSGHRTPPWIDISFDVRGPLTREALNQFEADWAEAGHESMPKIDAGAAESAPLPAIFDQPAPFAQFLPSGPDQSDDTVHALLTDACFNARVRLIAVTPYFVPDAVLQMALVLAARRGIAVDLIVPRRSNHRLADLARPAALRELLQAGARIWFTPQMLHAKLVVVDETVAFCGSVNLDERSLFLNYEMMVAFYDQQAITAFAHWAHEVRSNASTMQAVRVGVLREFGEGLLRWLTFQL